MKRVLIIYSGDMSKSEGGGIKNYILELVRHRTDLTIDIISICDGDVPDGFNNNFIYTSTTRFRPRIVSFLFDIIWKRLTRKLILPRYSTVIFNRHEEALLIPFLPAKNRILLVHGSVRYGYRFWPFPVAFLNSQLERMIFPFITSLYVLLQNDNFGVPYYKKRYPKNSSKIKYAPVPLAPSFVSYSGNQIDGKPHDLKVIYFGRVIDNPKNVMQLPYYVKEFIVQNINIKITIAGTGPDLQKLIDKTISLKINERFLFLGNIPIENLPAIVSQHHLSIILSDFEGICMSALESLFVKVPVAAMPVGDIPTYVKDMENGVLLNNKVSPAVNVRKILNFLSNYKFYQEYLFRLHPYLPNNCFLLLDL